MAAFVSGFASAAKAVQEDPTKVGRHRGSPAHQVGGPPHQGSYCQRVVSVYLRQYMYTSSSTTLRLIHTSSSSSLKPDAHFLLSLLLGDPGGLSEHVVILPLIGSQGPPPLLIDHGTLLEELQVSSCLKEDADHTFEDSGTWNGDVFIDTFSSIAHNSDHASASGEDVGTCAGRLCYPAAMRADKKVGIPRTTRLWVKHAPDVSISIAFHFWRKSSMNVRLGLHACIHCESPLSSFTHDQSSFRSQIAEAHGFDHLRDQAVPLLARAVYANKLPRLVVVLRNPIDRLHSAYYGYDHYFSRHGRNPSGGAGSGRVGSGRVESGTWRTTMCTRVNHTPIIPMTHCGLPLLPVVF